MARVESLPHEVYVGLGSNLEDPRDQISRALDELAALPDSALCARSSLYRTPPMGPPGQPDYINAVAMLRTALAPHAFLDALQALEQRHARVRAGRWGPRTLDLDLLLYDTARIADSRLTVPHPGIVERAFVLAPLAEIAPALEIPGHGQVMNLLATIDLQGISRV